MTNSAESQPVCAQEASSSLANFINPAVWVVEERCQEARRMSSLVEVAWDYYYRSLRALVDYEIDMTLIAHGAQVEGAQMLSDILAGHVRVSQDVVEYVRKEGMVFQCIILKHLPTGSRAIPVLRYDENYGFFWKHRWLPDEEE